MTSWNDEHLAQGIIGKEEMRLAARHEQLIALLQAAASSKDGERSDVLLKALAHENSVLRSMLFSCREGEGITTDSPFHRECTSSSRRSDDHRPSPCSPSPGSPIEFPLPPMPPPSPPSKHREVASWKRTLLDLREDDPWSVLEAPSLSCRNQPTHVYLIHRFNFHVYTYVLYTIIESYPHNPTYQCISYINSLNALVRMKLQNRRPDYAWRFEESHGLSPSIWLFPDVDKMPGKVGWSTGIRWNLCQRWLEVLRQKNLEHWLCGVDTST